MPFLRPALGVATLTLALSAALLAQTPDSSLLTLDRIFDSDEFAPEPLGGPRWIPGEAAYARLEPDSAAQGAAALVRYDAASGRREVWVPAVAPRSRRRHGPARRRGLRGVARPEAAAAVHQLAARCGGRTPAATSGRSISPPGRLRKLGGPAAAPSTLMFAKFSPDGGRVAYVREHDLYVEDVADGRITRLTRDGSRTIINGTFDWVYEEELNLRDGFRWSPDGRRIAFWQLDASGVRDFDLINDTDSLYSFVVPVQYPKAGTTNSAARVGVVSADGGEPAGSTSPATRATTTSPGSSGRRARTRSCSST